ncbi:CDP-alcohol phosphatidyltransferase family protein [Nioella aestuarii]
MLAPLARLMARFGMRADQVTLSGFALGLLVLPALWSGHTGLALVLIGLNRLADGLDGALARLQGPTDRGAFLDIALDFLFYALVPLGFALTDPAMNALPAAILLTSFVGTGSSFLAFSVLAQKRGVKPADYPSKGIAYLGGLTEGAETILFFVAICLWPTAFPILAYAFATAAFITTVSRWLIGWRLFHP